MASWTDVLEEGHLKKLITVGGVVAVAIGTSYLIKSYLDVLRIKLIKEEFDNICAMLNFNELGHDNARVILGIELACFALLAIGMLVDNAWIYPDDSLAAGKGPKCLSCPNAGCIGSAHSIWHVLAIAAAVKGALSRELALSMY